MRVFVAFVLVSLLALVGVRSATVEETAADLLLSIAIGCVLAVSCVTDARRIGRPLPSGAGFAILVLWPIAVPIYLLSSRGTKKGGLLALGFVTAVVSICLIAYCITSYVVRGEVAF